MKTKANIQGIRPKNGIFQVIVSAVVLKKVALLWWLKYTSEMSAFNFGKINNITLSFEGGVLSYVL